MKNKKIIITAIVFVLMLSTVIVGYLYWQQKYGIGPVAKSIIHEIESSADSNGECTIDLSTHTDFEWDTVVIVSADFLAAGYPPETIKEMWGFEYEFPPGFRSRLIFLKDDNIVHDESYLASIESSEKFNISIQGAEYYRILTVDDANVTSCCSDGNYYLTFQ